MDFFGIPAATTTAVATLALRTGAAVIPGFLIWDSIARKHRLRFDPSVQLISTGDSAHDILENTQAFNASSKRSFAAIRTSGCGSIADGKRGLKGSLGSMTAVQRRGV